jgi:hypothetical protein
VPVDGSPMEQTLLCSEILSHILQAQKLLGQGPGGDLA